MSNRRGRPRMRPYRPHVARQLQADRTYGVAIAWARDTDTEEEARQGTHDRVIEKMGDRRTGPVQWRITRDAHDGMEVLRLLEADQRHQEDLETVRECRKLLATYGGLIIVALAEGVPE